MQRLSPYGATLEPTLDKGHEIHHYVREITISDFGIGSMKFNKSQLLQVITNVKQLNKFK